MHEYVAYLYLFIYKVFVGFAFKGINRKIKFLYVLYYYTIIIY